MLSVLVSLLVFALVAGVLLYVAKLIITAAALAQPWANLAYALVVLIVLVLFLSEMGWVGGAHGWRSGGLWR